MEFPIKDKYLSVVLWNKGEEGPGSLEQQIRELWHESEKSILITMLGKEKYLFVTAYGEFQSSQIRAKCRQMIQLNEKVCIGIGFETDNLMAVSSSIEIAMLNVEQSFFDSEKRVFEIEKEIPRMKKLNPGLYAEFVQVLKEQPEKICQWLKKLIAEICREGYYWQEDITMLLSAFAKLLVQEKSALLLSVADIHSEEEIEQKIHEATSIEAVMSLLEQLTAAYMAHMEQEQPYSRLVKDTIAYIEGHCQKPELSVTDIAADMHFSAAHLNVLFRKETGVTIKQYINDYRMSLSKKLLLNPHIKIVEIAEQCGYSNANYFSKVFRSTENMTPLEYRKAFMK